MLEKTTSIFPNRAIEEFVEDIKSITQEIQELYCLDSIPWIIGVSWGKDSTAVLQLVWNAIASLPEEKRQKKSLRHNDRHIGRKSYSNCMGK